jgi:hypothetical protein
MRGKGNAYFAEIDQIRRRLSLDMTSLQENLTQIDKQKLPEPSPTQHAKKIISCQDMWTWV